MKAGSDGAEKSTSMFASRACGVTNSVTSRASTAQVEILQMNVQGPRKIQERFHHSVQAEDFLGENIDLAGKFMVRLAQPGPQQLQPEADGVQRILDLVRHASGKTADGGQSRGDVQLRGHAFQQLIHVVAQLGGILARAAILLAQQVEFAFDGAEFLGRAVIRFFTADAALRDAVDGVLDPFHRPQGSGGRQHRQQQGQPDRAARNNGQNPDLLAQRIAQKQAVKSPPEW